MNGIMNENRLTIVKTSENTKPLVHKTDSLIDNCYRDCHNKYFHRFKYDSLYDNNLTKITNNEILNLTIADQIMNLYGIEKNEKWSTKWFYI